jgi:hypothetical protein
MTALTFRLTDNVDPEERIEEAALWKAMHDEYGEEIAPVTGDVPATFGRLRRNESEEIFDYWNDPAFLLRANRSFVTVSIDGVDAAVATLHAVGVDAFIKSTRMKHAIFRVPVGRSWSSVCGEMIYSFIDGGPELMVQEFCQIDDEHRFFCIDRKLVTVSRNSPELTPLDYPMKSIVVGDDRLRELTRVAATIAREMRTPHAVIDVAFINGRAGAVELNPMRLGMVGLFASDVRALAKASRYLAPTPDRSGEADKTENTGLAEGESGLPEGSSKP